MGSGVSGLYSGTYGAVAAGGAGGSGQKDKGSGSSSSERKSQPYASSYGVTDEMLEYDKDRGVFSDEKGYSLNPTAVDAVNSVRDGVLVGHDGKPMDGSYTYAVKENGDLVIGKRNGNGKEGKATPHPTLVGGKDPKVRIAGIVTMSKGKIVKYDNESGHFKPNNLSMPAADEAFLKLPSSAFHRNFNKNMGRR